VGRANRFWGPDVRAFPAIAVWFVGCELVIRPPADVPVVDDWTYAWSVQHLLDTGRLTILPISAVYPVTQILWGPLSCLPAGFSFCGRSVFSRNERERCPGCAHRGPPRAVGEDGRSVIMIDHASCLIVERAPSMLSTVVEFGAHQGR